jgi:DNA invertase Pin-like site-specific DNA recombinase
MDYSRPRLAMTSNPRLIAYIRVSDVGDREGEAFQSVRQQREAIEAIVRLTPGASIAEEIVDLNVSGGSMERERVHDAIERVERGDADGIVVAYLDRWARTVDALSMFRRWADEGRWFLSAAEKFDASTSQGRFALGMMLLVAQFYREQLTERFALSQRNAITRGAFIGPTPLGYRRIEDPLSPRVGCLEPDPTTGPIVTETYGRAARDGIAAAARHLGRSTSDTRRLLSNRVYLGEVRHATAGRNLNAHEPLTDLGTWTAAQLKPRRRAHSVAYPLSGIARCAGCGGPLTGQLSRDRQGSRGRRYRCSRRRSDSCVSIGADVLEAHTRAVIADAIGTGRPVASPGGDSLAEAEEALRVAETILNEYAADTELQADLGIEAYRAGARERREAVQAAQRAYQEESARASAVVTLPASDELDDDQQLTRALEAMVDAIEVSGGRRAVEDRVRVRWAIHSYS